VRRALVSLLTGRWLTPSQAYEEAQTLEDVIRDADLLPGIKINTDAMAKATQLAQRGFVKITEG
jgi:hypothetical protein